MSTTPPPGFYFFITIFWLVVACTILMVLFKVAVWWGERPARGARTVNDYQDTRPRVMSRSENTVLVERLSSKDGQSDGRTDSLVYERAELQMFYTLLRKHGVSREEARPVLKAMRIPLSNDVWASAAPAADDTPHVTPYAGRPTSARFDVTDLDYPYQKPA